MKTLRIPFLAAVLTTLFTLMVSADTVVLKSGTTLVGKVTNYSGTSLSILTNMGITAEIPADQVASVSFGNTTPPPPRRLRQHRRWQRLPQSQRSRPPQL